MATRVTFSAPTSISHRPDPTYRPPEHYAGLVNPATTLKVTGGVTWEWAPMSLCWVHPTYPMQRIYFDDNTYVVTQGGVTVESGTWTAVA